MKTCISCAHFKRSVIEVAPGQHGMAFVCSHEECIDPVTGDPIPCNLARQQIVFCGITAKYWKEKEKELVKGNIIELSK